jgi:hypothetical protein
MTTTTVEVLAIGEPLALVDPLEGGPIEDVPGFTLKVAGAELNALIGLARLGHRTALVSAVGDDPFGRLVRRTIRAEGIDDAFVFTGSAPDRGLPSRRGSLATGGACTTTVRLGRVEGPRRLRSSSTR